MKNLVSGNFNLAEDKYSTESYTYTDADGVEKTKNRITIEYTLIGGINDDIVAAKELAISSTKGLSCLFFLG